MDNSTTNYKTGICCPPIVGRSERSKLVEWLKKPCDYSNGIFEDPGYSEYYQSHFNISNEDGVFYDSKSDPSDIDVHMNMGNLKHHYENEDNDMENTMFSMFEMYKDIIESKNKEVNIDIVIPPGSNQSNSNYIFKLIKTELMKLDSINIPMVSKDPRTKYSGETRQIIHDVSKEDVYNFVMNHSDVKCRK